MTAPDPTAASRARAAGSGDYLALGEMVTAVEYDIVGERDGRFAQVRPAIATIELARTGVGNFAQVSPDVTWHVIARTTTTAETLADHLLTPQPPRAVISSRSTSPRRERAIPTTSSAAPTLALTGLCDGGGGGSGCLRQRRCVVVARAHRARRGGRPRVIFSWCCGVAGEPRRRAQVAPRCPHSRKASMILTSVDFARFDHLDAASRWQVIEDYRTAGPHSPAGRRRAVEDLMEQLCLQVRGALWAPGFDAQAWEMLHHADHSRSGQQPCPARGQDASWADLSTLTTQAGWWPIFDRGEPDPFTLGRVATLAQASAAYPPPGRCQGCHHRGQAGASGGRARPGRATVVIDIADPAPRGALTPR